MNRLPAMALCVFAVGPTLAQVELLDVTLEVLDDASGIDAVVMPLEGVGVPESGPGDQAEAGREQQDPASVADETQESAEVSGSAASGDL